MYLQNSIIVKLFGVYKRLKNQVSRSNINWFITSPLISLRTLFRIIQKNWIIIIISHNKMFEMVYRQLEIQTPTLDALVNMNKDEDSRVTQSVNDSNRHCLRVNSILLL